MRITLKQLTTLIKEEIQKEDLNQVTNNKRKIINLSITLGQDEDGKKSWSIFVSPLFERDLNTLEKQTGATYDRTYKSFVLPAVETRPLLDQRVYIKNMFKSVISELGYEPKYTPELKGNK
jgi:hypothetical protein